MLSARNPIGRRILAAVLLTSAVTLLVAGAAFSAYDFLTFRAGMIEHITSIARMTAANSTAALAFDSRQDAEETLAALQAESQIVSAALYDRAGLLFAAHGESPPERLPGASVRYGWSFDGAHLESVQPVVQGANERLGTLLIRADTAAVYDRLELYAGIAGLILGIALLVAYLLSRVFQRQIADPVVRLANVAESVSTQHDYSVRAPQSESPELRVLTTAFNQMLEQVGQSEARMRGQLTRLDLLQSITRAIAERQDLPSIFQVLASRLEADLPLDLCLILHYARGEGVLVVEGMTRRATDRLQDLPARSRVAPDENGIGRCLRGELVYEPDITGVHFAFPARLAAAGLRSFVAAPLAAGSDVFGVLVAARDAPGAFSSGDCEFLRQLSEHVALAVHQVGLYEALQRAYEDLRQSQITLAQQERLRALGQMASGIAHDINNAITPIGLYADSLLDTEKSLSPRGRGYLATIQRAIEDVSQSVARLREFYRQRERQIAPESFDVNAVIAQVVEITRTRWSDEPNERGVFIDLKTELTAEALYVLGNAAEVRDALINLVFNAVDAMPEGGVLTLRTSAAADPGSNGDGRGRVTIEVQDTGAGMDETTRRRCLEPFFTTKGERGTGMGLAMVFGMTERHGARLAIDTAPGRGTTVSLVFPQAAAGAAAAAAAPAVDPVPSRLQLLVIDDDPLLLQSLRDTLESEGHFVTVADGGQAGIDAFAAGCSKDTPAEVVITDLGMPHLDGRAVAAAVKAISPDTPVLLLTGWGHRLIEEQEIPPGVDRVISKPPKLRELRVALAELAARNRAKAEA